MLKIMHILTLVNNLNFKTGDHVRILKYKIIFAKGYSPNWSGETFVIKEVKNTVPWAHFFNDLSGEEIIGTFYERNYKILIRKNLGQKK